ncbi:Acg family FMN-binding oxidoreductase [Longimicrobium sp.]|uniref:Acg family FMN-binding oxidoreductase n=1 Tax=Longimicrobium sp. TaxID=2029185 RepID=UPI002E35E91D|nr:nitroreductase family protein [Longimicrobium sp.]HEX6042579.1 nitroreductase family protein [Longimicrobium sp.]
MQTVASTDPWSVSEADYPADASEPEQLRHLLRYAVLAPSAHNAQPWRFRVTDAGIELHADRSRALPVSDPDGRELVIGCGAALFFLRVAVRRFGHMDRVHLFPDPARPDLLALVSRGDEARASREVLTLFRAIRERRTYRPAFEERAVGAPDLAALLEAAEDEGGWLRPVAGPLRDDVAALVEEADKRQYADSAFRRELAGWIRSGTRGVEDGIPAYALGIPDLLAPLGPTLMGALNLGGMRGGSDRRAAQAAPLLAVLGTEGDRPSDWLHAGQSLARVLLAGQARGLSAAFLNQPVQVPELRARLREMLGREAWPQVIVRMGHGKALPPTPRRTVEEVLVS